MNESGFSHNNPSVVRKSHHVASGDFNPITHNQSLSDCPAISIPITEVRLSHSSLSCHPWLPHWSRDAVAKNFGSMSAHDATYLDRIECSVQPLDISFHPQRDNLVAAALVDGTLEGGQRESKRTMLIFQTCVPFVSLTLTFLCFTSSRYSTK